MPGTDLDQQEKSAADLEKEFGGDFTPAEHAEADQLNTAIGGNDPSQDNFYNASDDDGKGKRRGLTRKQQVAGGGVGLIGGIMLLFGGGSLGPLEFIHKAQILSRMGFSTQESFGDDRSAKFLLYALSGKAAKGRLGVLGNKVADRWERRLVDKSGLKPVYDSRDGRFRGLQVVDADKAGPTIKEMGEDIPRRGAMAGGVTDVDGKPLTGAQDFLDITESKFKNRRSMIRAAIRSVGSNGVSSRIGSRLLIKRGGVNFHPLTNWVKRKAGDRDIVRRQKAQEHKTGEAADYNNPPDVDPDNPDTDLPDPDKPDTDLPDPNADPDLPDGPDGPRSRMISKLKNVAKASSGPLLAVGVVCGLKDFSSSVDSMNKESIEIARRMGMDGITMGFQSMAGKDTSADILGAFSEYMYDEETRTTWAQDPYIQQEVGNDPSGYKDYNEDFKPGKDKHFILQTVDNFPDVGMCAAYNTVTGFFGDLPGPKQVADIAGRAIDAGIKPLIGKDTNELMNDAIKFAANGGVNLFAEGAERGGIEGKGVELAAMDKCIAMGCRELTDEEATQVKTVAMLEDREEFQQLSVWDRYFNIYDSRTMIAGAYMNAPKDLNQTVAFITKLPTKFGSLLTPFIPKAHAQERIKRSFPTYGFSMAERRSVDTEDPFANADYIESGDRLETLNNEYGNECFGMTIGTDGNLKYDKAVDFTKLPDKCKSSDPDLVRYRFYIADMVSMHSLACYEGDDNSCVQVGMAQDTNATTATDSPTPTGPVNAGEDTSDMACPAGTDEGNVVQDYGPDGQPTIKIKLCGIPDAIPAGSGVNASIAAQTLEMIKAMQAAGLTPKAGAYRSYESQVSLRRQNCPDPINSPANSCRPPTAKAGTSMHEVGLAIDFQNMCYRNATCPPGTNSRYDWLVSNASKYGFTKLRTEAWHWSVGGN